MTEGFDFFETGKLAPKRFLFKTFSNLVQIRREIEEDTFEIVLLV